MAADWIKMRTDLGGDPAVIRIRRATGVDADAVVGKLHRLWSWADAHTSDGYAAGLDADWVDEFAGCPGFAAAMAAAGWLQIDADGVRFANFDRHNGQPAKVRALRKTRMERFRGARSATDAPPEKRREEIEKKLNTHTQAADAEFRQPGWAADEWARFAASWNVTERAEPWRPLTAPDSWVDLAASPGWLDKARQAVARLPRCEFFDRPLAVTRFFEYVDRILAGEFDNAKQDVRGRKRQPTGGNL